MYFSISNLILDGKGMLNMDHDIESLYAKLPYKVQKILINVEGWRIHRRRYPSYFTSVLHEYENFLDLNDNRRLTIMMHRLREHLCYHAMNSSYYNALFKRYGFKPEQIENPKDLGVLPIHYKSDILANMSDIITDVGRKSRIVHTSGTTGSGLQFPEPVKAELHKWAVWWRYRKMHGLDCNTWCSYFGGRTLLPPTISKPPYWHVCYPLRQVMYSMYHLSATTVKNYVEDLNRRQIPWIHGYPSTICLLASLMEQANLRLTYPIRTISVGAENLLVQQVEVITRVLGCRPIQHYGLTEPVANISLHPDGKLRIDEDYSFVELVEIPESDHQYRIIGTSLWNDGILFLRYDTGDVVTLYNPSATVFDGGMRQVESIDGRKEDYLVLPNGRWIGRLDHIFKDATTIAEAQILQEADLSVRVLFVPRSDFREGDIETLKAEFISRIGNEVSIRFERVGHIQRGPNGKIRFVISAATGNITSAISRPFAKGN